MGAVAASARGRSRKRNCKASSAVASHELRDFVSVILNTSGEGSDAAALTRFIHQACVRRRVVARRRGDGPRASRQHVLEQNRCSCVNGVPEELLTQLGHDDNLERTQRQKAATGGFRGGARGQLQAQRSGTRANQSWIQTTHAKANLLHLADVADPGQLDRIQFATRQAFVDQFQPWYFGVAFAFLFKYCAGMPDPPQWSKEGRWRCDPHVSLASWARAMARRVEAQLNRDWAFGFASWTFARQ